MNTLRDASDFVSAKFVNGGDEKKNKSMPNVNVEEGARNKSVLHANEYYTVSMRQKTYIGRANLWS